MPSFIDMLEEELSDIVKTVREIDQSIVDEVVDQVNEVEEIDEVDEMMGYADKTPNFEKMTPIELRDWAKENGFGSQIKNIRNKEKLIEILRG